MGGSVTNITDKLLEKENIKDGCLYYLMKVLDTLDYEG